MGSGSVKVGDKVLFRYGFSRYSGKVREISEDGKYMRVRFGPWRLPLSFGQWVETDHILSVIKYG